MKKIVIAAAAAIALLKAKITPRMKKAIPFIGRFELRYLGNSKGPLTAGLFYFLGLPKSSGPE